MATTQDVVRYFVQNYPYPDELSKTRLTKLVYLADWFSARERHKQLTPIEWYFDHYGPYVRDVFDAVSNDDQLIITHSRSSFGGSKETVTMRPGAQLKTRTLGSADTRILDEVISKTKSLTWGGFIAYVYDTYPIRTRERYSVLRLVEIAREAEKAVDSPETGSPRMDSHL